MKKKGEEEEKWEDKKNKERDKSEQKRRIVKGRIKQDEEREYQMWKTKR